MNCEFRKKYDEFCLIQEGKPYKKSYKIVAYKICVICGTEFAGGKRKFCSDECLKEWNRAYRQIPNQKAKKKAYDISPKRREIVRAYYQLPKSIARRKAYEQRQDVKAQKIAYMKKYRRGKELEEIIFNQLGEKK